MTGTEMEKMTTTLNTFTAYGLLNRIQAIVDGHQANRARRAAYQTAYASLQRISDAELKEFGLFRSDLSEIARVEAAKA